MASPNLKSDFSYSYTKYPKIAFKILKKWQKSLRRVFFFFRVKLILFVKRKNAKSIRIFIVIKIVSCISPNIARVQIKMSVWCSLVVKCISLRSFSILNLFPIEKTSFILDGSK